MAVTFAITDLSRDVTSKRRHSGTITCTGTTTDDGDTITAAALGLSVIDDMKLETFLDSTSNPENAFHGAFNKNSGKIVFYTAHGTPGAAVPSLQITDGTSVSGYFARFEATGR